MGLKTAVLAAAAVLGMASASHAAVNIVTNGDFSAGNTGFTSGYMYDAYANTPPNGLYLEGHYTVGSNPAAVGRRATALRSRSDAVARCENESLGTSEGARCCPRRGRG